MQTGIDLSIDGRVARLTLNNPQRHNLLGENSIRQFLDHLQVLESSSGIRAVILTGAGDETFCSGMSLDQIRSGVIDTDLFESFTERFARLPIPKIAAMNGNAYGGGVELGLCCEYRLGVKDMKIMVPAAKFGLCYPISGIRRFVSRVGPSAARRILVSAETINAADLLRMGYLQRICEAGELAGQADELAREISRLAPMAVVAMLKMIERVAVGTLDERQAQQWVGQCNSSDDLQEGLEAALAKREPEFQGR
jgi:enoyl-CoA hydratase/carnithine racemase